MPLIDIDEYRDTYFSPRSRPPKNTVRLWIREGKLPAEKHGRKYYIDTDKIGPSTGNKLADRVLRKSRNVKR